jgi:hypothetical protein
MCLGALFRCFGFPRFIRNESIALNGEFNVGVMRGRVPLPETSDQGSVKVSVFYPR